MSNPTQDQVAHLDRLSQDQRRRLIEKLKRKRTAAGGRPADGSDKIPKNNGLTEAPLSFAQERLWFLDQLEGPNAAYNIPLAWHLSGPLHVDALEKSLRVIVSRHDALRTRIVMHGGTPMQRFPAGPEISLPRVDLGHLDFAEGRQEMLKRIEAEDLRPFQPASDHLTRAELLKLAPAEHVLLLTFHHMVFDGWSLGIFSRELSAAYTALRAGKIPLLPELDLQYADFAVWQRRRFQSARPDQGLRFRATQLAGAPALLELPYDRPHPRRRSYRGSRFAFTVSNESTAGLKTLAKGAGATLFMALLALYALLLSRYSSQRDMVIGTPVSGRQRPELEGLIGLFINTLLLRIRFSGRPTFRQLLLQVKAEVLKARTHEETPFEKLVETLAPRRNLSHTPLFQAAFVLQNMPLTPPRLPDIAVTPLETDRLTAKFDLNLIMTETAFGLSAGLEYNTDIFEAETIARMARHFQNLLQGVLANPEAAVFELPLDSPSHNPPPSSPPTRITAPHARLLHRIFARQAARRPQAVALKIDARRFTYQEVEARANRLANYLQSRDIGPEVPVALLLRRSAELVIAMLGVLKAGGAYLPLDPDIPAERLTYILKDSQAALLITESALEGTRPIEGTPTLVIDRDRAAIDRMGATPPVSRVCADNLAYIIYTSGSTGAPKGSLVTHHNVTRLFAATADLFHFSDDDVFTLFHSCAFDFSVWEMWGALLHGGVLVIVPHLVCRSPDELRALLHRERVTVLNQTPAAFRQLIPAEREAAPDEKLALKWVIFGGEALDARQLAPWFAKYGDRSPQLVNMYGITETTVHVTRHLLTRADADKPGSCIGRPIPDLRLHILDPHLNPVPPGVKGEIYVEGPGICRGYLRRPGLTARTFIPNPFAAKSERGSRLYKTGDLACRTPDGTVTYLGRRDRQIKIRGFRVETGEIEAALARHPEIRQAVVNVYAEAAEDVRLAAYLVCRRPVAKEALRDFLKKRLPEYMLPAAYVELSRIPLTVNGKIDRKQLPRPGPAPSGRSCAPPRDETEQILAHIWGRLLKQNRVGRHDDFFSLGGHSLLAVQVISRIRAAFQVSLPVSQIFEEPTIAGLAIRIRQARAAETTPTAPAGEALETVQDDWEEGEI